MAPWDGAAIGVSACAGCGFSARRLAPFGELRSQAESSVNQVLAIFYARLAMSVIISLFGIVGGDRHAARHRHHAHRMRRMIRYER